MINQCFHWHVHNTGQIIVKYICLLTAQKYFPNLTRGSSSATYKTSKSCWNLLYLWYLKLEVYNKREPSLVSHVLNKMQIKEKNLVETGNLVNSNEKENVMYNNLQEAGKVVPWVKALVSKSDSLSPIPKSIYMVVEDCLCTLCRCHGKCPHGHINNNTEDAAKAINRSKCIAVNILLDHKKTLNQGTNNTTQKSGYKALLLPQHKSEKRA